MRGRAARIAAFLFFWLVAVAYLAWRADRGWIPHDEGFLGQSAERVLLGEQPHRDFDEPYTGGLSYLHAAAFRLFGVRLLALRWTLLIFSAAFAAAVWAIARRVVGPVAAGLVLWLALAWSLPLYFAALPSWYNLFFAVFGTLALLRFLETDARRWLFAAGLCGGLSFLIKLVGLYYVAAVLLFLVYREQVQAEEDDDCPEGNARGFRGLVAAGLCGFSALLVLVLRSPGVMEILHFLLPGVVLAAFLIWNEHRIDRGSSDRRWVRLWRLLVPFVAGCTLPVLVYALPYLASDSMGDLLYGVFFLPQKRFEFAARALPATVTLVTVLPLAALLAAGARRRSVEIKPWLLAAAAGAVGLLLAFGDREPIHRAIWYSLRPLVPLAVVAGCWLLARGAGGAALPALRRTVLPALRRQQLFLVLSVTAMVSLVQYPESFGVYFGYVAPLAALALLFLVASQSRAPRALHALLLIFYLAFAVLWLHRSWVQAMGIRFWPVTHDATLALERGGIMVARQQAETYRELVARIQERSAEGDSIYATPDCPEVYFLAARRNPTRTFYDFFEDDYDRPMERTARLAAMLEEQGVEVVVFNRSPQFSYQIPAALIVLVERRYPNRVDVPPYSVHWR